MHPIFIEYRADYMLIRNSLVSLRLHKTSSLYLLNDNIQLTLDRLIDTLKVDECRQAAFVYHYRQLVDRHICLMEQVVPMLPPYVQDRIFVVLHLIDLAVARGIDKPAVVRCRLQEQLKNKSSGHLWQLFDAHFDNVWALYVE